MADPIRLPVDADEGNVQLTVEEMRVVEAVSPTVTAERDEDGVLITVHDLNGTRTAHVNDGETGPQGPRGIQGEKGETGATGATPDMSIGTVQTLPAGSQATAQISGTAEQPVLSLGIPKGDPGSVPIDDTAGAGDTTKVWSADKSAAEVSDLKSALNDTPSIKESTKTGVDLDISDTSGNVILRLANGHIQTKEFDSSDIHNIPYAAETQISDANADLDISDTFGNILARFKDGQFKTKNFDTLRFADVKAFGAVGDGITDDTEAIETAMSFGFDNNTPVRFSSGTYMIRRPLTLRSNMEIYGEGNAIIKCKASATTTLTASCAEGDETITVASTTGFQIGDPVAISMNNTGDAAARHCSVGYITSLTETTITFTSAYDSIKKGAVKAHEVGCKVSNACAIFRSWGMLFPCDNVYIHNLILDGNRQEDEWADWFAGCIHIDAYSDTVEGITWHYSQKNNTFRDLTLLNGHFDGISDQGNGGATIENCKIDNPYWHGVHFGTTYSNANVINNVIKNTINGAGVFWCAGAQDIIVEGNRFIGCHKGCSDYEYGTAGNKSIINGNIFIGTESYIFDFSLGTADDQGTIIITDNIIESPGWIIARLKNREKVVFSSNIIETLESGISSLFDCTGSDSLTFIGNIAPDTETTIISGNPTNVINAQNSWN